MQRRGGYREKAGKRSLLSWVFSELPVPGSKSPSFVSELPVLRTHTGLERAAFFSYVIP